MEVHREPVGLESVMFEIGEHYSQSCREKGLDLILQYEEDTESNIWTDPTHLRSILWHLIDNAIKFTSAGSITLTLQNDPDQVVFTLTDTGMGIPDKDMHMIFDAFMQKDVSTTRRYEGNGLGLSIVKGLMDLIEGQLVMESKEGAGTKVTLILKK